MGTELPALDTTPFGDAVQNVNELGQVYDTPESLAALEYLRQLTVEDKVMAFYPRVWGIVGIDEVPSFLNSRLAMIGRWMSFLPTLADSGFEVGMVPYPRSTYETGRYATDLAIWGLAISQTTEHPDAAWRFVAYATGREGAELCGQLDGCVPARPAPITWLPDNLINPELFGDLLTVGGLRILSLNRDDLDAAVTQELNRMYDNAVPPQTAAASITARFAGMLAEE